MLTIPARYSLAAAIQLHLGAGTAMAAFAWNW
jgi:hypothetical protein